MYFELPKVKRCCCCAPLRYGLMVWGYVKLIVIIALMLLISVNIYVMITRRGFRDVYFVSVLGLCSVLELIMVTILLVGAHRKNPKLLNIYYVYSLINFLLCLFLFILNVIFEIIHVREFIADVWFYVLENASIGFFYLLLNFYLIIVLRSEIRKLRDRTKFQFVNNAAEAECTLDLESDTTKDSTLNHEAFKV